MERVSKIHHEVNPSTSLAYTEFGRDGDSSRAFQDI